jgi:hypothetical protein
LDPPRQTLPSNVEIPHEGPEECTHCCLFLLVDYSFSANRQMLKF